MIVLSDIGLSGSGFRVQGWPKDSGNQGLGSLVACSKFVSRLITHITHIVTVNIIPEAQRNVNPKNPMSYALRQAKSN